MRPSTIAVLSKPSVTAKNLSGSLCALATPFHDRDGRPDALDTANFVRLIDYQIESGTSGLVVAGSTGEAAALDEREFADLVERTGQHTAARVPVLAGTGQQSTRKTIEQTRRAAAAGADAALVVVPPYVRATQEGLYRHFSMVADQGGLPVVLYNVPARSAGDLLPETVARLTAHGNIIGIKEARAEPERMRALAEFAAPAFAVLSGDDSTWLRALRTGASGVISVAANVAPALLSELHAAHRAGHADEADQRDRDLQPLYRLLGIEPNPIPVKWCLAELDIGTPAMRLPLLSLSPAHHAEARQVLKKLGLIEARRAVG